MKRQIILFKLIEFKIFESHFLKSLGLQCSKFTEHLAAPHTLSLFLRNTCKENKLTEMLCLFSLHSACPFQPLIISRLLKSIGIIILIISNITFIQSDDLATHKHLSSPQKVAISYRHSRMFVSPKMPASLLLCKDIIF